uniref:MADF domain-containing protein n=1 Tax=Cacopsylla melanoneura TaxID=428564 RepID=A0A8D8ZGQ1_9HEMI
MSFSDKEDDMLIELVRQKPPLYDTRLESYRDGQVRGNIWEEIEKAMKKLCTPIKSILTKLPPTLRVEAKTKVFNILAEYELQSVQQTERSSNFLQDHSSSSYSNPSSHTLQYQTHSLF